VSVDRYENDNVFTSKSGARLLETNRAIPIIRSAVKSGALSVVERVLASNTRLDIIAHQQYGDGRLWWVIAAASGIGWWLQAPAGTRIVIPVDIESVENLL
jgi:hypothetical protein